MPGLYQGFSLYFLQLISASEKTKVSAQIVICWNLKFILKTLTGIIKK